MKLLLTLLTLLALANADIQITPTGEYVNGTPQIAPDGSYVGQGAIVITPDGNYIAIDQEGHIEANDDYLKLKNND